MENQSYRLISGLAGFLLLPHGQTLEVTIPVNAVVTVLKQPSDGTGSRASAMQAERAPFRCVSCRDVETPFALRFCW